MPFQKNYTDPLGTNFPTSFWQIRYLSLNTDGSGSSIHQGWASVADHDTLGDAGIIGEHLFNTSDPEVYEDTFGLAMAAQIRLTQPVGYFIAVEQGLAQHDDFFSMASGVVQLSYVVPDGAEVGSAGAQRVTVTFPAPIAGTTQTPLYTQGVTIKINGATTTAPVDGSADATKHFVYYDLVDTVEPGDVVTWEYAGIGFGSGDMRVIGEGQLHAISPITVVNSVGAFWRFNEAGNSGQFAIHF